jgi:hypothetical protein
MLRGRSTRERASTSIDPGAHDLGHDLRVEPGGRKRQRNRRKGAPPRDEELMYPSLEGPIIYALASSLSAWWRKRRQRRRSWRREHWVVNALVGAIAVSLGGEVGMAAAGASISFVVVLALFIVALAAALALADAS